MSLYSIYNTASWKTKKLYCIIISIYVNALSVYANFMQSKITLTIQVLQLSPINS